jgi:polyhydroxyalkanoate synthesis regulator phasin
MSSSKARRRNLNPISLAFLDVMFCGFGAVILIFLILDHNSSVTSPEPNSDLAAEVNLLREEVNEGELGLVALRNTISDVSLEVVTAEGLARQIQEQIQTFLQELAALENSSIATEESIEKLRADVESLTEELLRLEAAALEQEGSSVRLHEGDGNRQYLSGLYLGGQKILILIDSSFSMLDADLLKIIRLRVAEGKGIFLSDDRKKQSPKWQRVVKTIDWISSRLPIASRYQIWEFNENLESVLGDCLDCWQEVADRDGLNDAIANVKEIVPANGTNMEQVFRAVTNMSSRPDNIFLITDGLPTLGARGPNNGYIDAFQREELFEDAVEELPSGIPVNIIMLPISGDPAAAGAFWELARYTQGAFITPSKDWP